MPEMDGIQLTKLIRELLKENNLKGEEHK